MHTHTIWPDKTALAYLLSNRTLSHIALGYDLQYIYPPGSSLANDSARQQYMTASAFEAIIGGIHEGPLGGYHHQAGTAPITRTQSRNRRALAEWSAKLFSHDVFPKLWEEVFACHTASRQNSVSMLRELRRAKAAAALASTSSVWPIADDVGD